MRCLTCVRNVLGLRECTAAVHAEELGTELTSACAAMHEMKASFKDSH